MSMWQVCYLNKLLEEANTRNQQLSLRILSIEADLERARAEAALAIKEKQTFERECVVSIPSLLYKNT